MNYFNKLKKNWNELNETNAGKSAKQNLIVALILTVLISSLAALISASLITDSATAMFSVTWGLMFLVIAYVESLRHDLVKNKVIEDE